MVQKVTDILKKRGFQEDTMTGTMLQVQKKMRALIKNVKGKKR